MRLINKLSFTQPNIILDFPPGGALTLTDVFVFTSYWPKLKVDCPPITFCGLVNSACCGGWVIGALILVGFSERGLKPSLKTIEDWFLSISTINENNYF
jgi:hypothetical protein